MPGEQFQIVLEENAKPVCVTTQRSVPFHYKEALKRELDKLEEKGIIAKQMAPMPWCLPVVIERESGRHMFVRRFQADELLCCSRTVSTQHAGGGRCRPGVGQNRREHRPYAPAEIEGPMLPPRAKALCSRWHKRREVCQQTGLGSTLRIRSPINRQVHGRIFPHSRLDRSV